MSLSPEQIAKIRQKEAKTPDALKRNPLNDYTEGWFHVTLNVRGEAPVLGYIVGDAEAPGGSENAPRCILTELGKRVEESWKSNPSFYPGIENIEFQIMPDHVHGLVHLKSENQKHLGQIVYGFMVGCTHAYWDTLGIPWREMTYEKGARAPQWQDRDHTRSFRGPALFVRGYNDVEAIGEEEIEIKRQYIRNNPRKRLITRSKPDCFRIHRNMKSANWTPERIMKGLCADRYIAADCNKQVEAWQQVTVKGIRNNRGKVSATLNMQTQTNTPPECAAVNACTAVGYLAHAQVLGNHVLSHQVSIRPVIDLVGNMDLLQRPLFPLVCHRADAHLFEQQKAAVLKVAREQGGVIVTACVSPKERAIVKLLQQELLPVIEVMDNGFSDKYKPTGKNFYAVAEQRRLEVSPWQYEYRQREWRPVKDGHCNPVLDANGNLEMEEIPDITREMCMVMNELVRMIAKKTDDWWKLTDPM
ncbi:MAG: hypothetical protein KBT20_09680 [Bacteroidales bacterium]|nr:hypothetical protein [Candidatus Liminaster caballi]